MFKKMCSYIGLVIVIVISLLTVQPLFHTGFFSMHDDTQVARVIEMGKALKEGQFPVRIVGDLGYGYGYPIFNFYGPLAYYVGGIFVLLGADALLATKLMIIVGFILAGIGMYLLVRSFSIEIGGIVAAIFYMYAPYHALDLYVRGDIGELFAYASLPFIFWSIWKIYCTKQWKYVIFASISISLLIVSHNLTALMTMPYIFLGVVCACIPLLMQRNIRGFIYELLALVLGIGLSTFYFLPALMEMKFTNVISQIGGKANPLDHFVCLSQFWYSPWGYGGSVPGCVDGLSFMLGKVVIVLLVICLILVPMVWRKNKLICVSMFAALLGATFSLFLTTEYSQVIWKTFSVMKFFQYPWRFLLPFSFFSSIGIGLLFGILPIILGTRITIALSVIAICVLVFLNGKLFVPQTYTVYPPSFYEQKDYLQFAASKISDEYMPKGFTKPQSVGQLPKTILQSRPDVILQVLHTDSTSKEVSASTLYDVRGQWNIAYFPYWHFFEDGKEIPFTLAPNGVYIVLKSGMHIYEARVIATPIEMLANALSVASILVLFLGIIYARKHVL